MFQNNAKEAVEFYKQVFEKSRVFQVISESVLNDSINVIEFKIENVPYTAIDGGGHFRFSEAHSIALTVHNQSEVDDLWEKLSVNGTEKIGGWLTDQFGLSWQILPQSYFDMIDPRNGSEKVSRVLQSLMTMKKIDEKDLFKAFYGE